MLLRPLAITRSGHGGSSRSLSSARAWPCPKASQGLSCFHGARNLTRLTTGITPSASATPRHWFSVPAMPSVMIQQDGGVVCKACSSRSKPQDTQFAFTFPDNFFRGVQTYENKKINEYFVCFKCSLILFHYKV